MTVGGRFQLLRFPQSNDGRFQRVPDRALFDPTTCDAAADPAACRGFIDKLANAFPAGFQNAFSANSFQADFRAAIALDPLGNGTNPICLGFGRYTGQLPAAILEESRDPFPKIFTDTSSSCGCGEISVPLASFRNPFP